MSLHVYIPFDVPFALNNKGSLSWHLCEKKVKKSQSRMGSVFKKGYLVLKPKNKLVLSKAHQIRQR